MKNNLDLENQEKELEAEIKAAEESVTVATALEKLLKNKDFKTVFSTHFFKECVAEAVKAKASYISDPAQARHYDNIINSLGTMQILLDNVIAEGETAKEFLNRSDEILAAIRKEQLNY